MDGIIVIGEGEKDEAPMLFNGEVLGTGELPQVDIAVDPIDGTSLTARGDSGALEESAAIDGLAEYAVQTLREAIVPDGTRAVALRDACVRFSGEQHGVSPQTLVVR